MMEMLMKTVLAEIFQGTKNTKKNPTGEAFVNVVPCGAIRSS